MLQTKVIKMARVESVVEYIKKRYPRGEELSNTRLVWMLYLADWKSVITDGKQITDIVWGLGDQGPYTSEGLGRSRKVRRVPKRGLDRSPRVNSGILTPEEVKVLDFVIQSCASKNWLELKRLVFSTYPVMIQRKAEKLNLPELAEGYRDTQELLVGS